MFLVIMVSVTGLVVMVNDVKMTDFVVMVKVVKRRV